MSTRTHLRYSEGFYGDVFHEEITHISLHYAFTHTYTTNNIQQNDTNVHDVVNTVCVGDYIAYALRFLYNKT